MWLEDILKHFGASPIFILIVIGLWKADEILQNTPMHKDVKGWLLGGSLQNPSPDWLAITQVYFLKVFGNKYFSWRCLAMVLLINLIIVLTLMAVSFLESGINNHVTSFMLIKNELFYLYLIGNIVSDYLAVMATRYLLNRFADTPKIVVFMLLSLLAYVILFLIVTIITSILGTLLTAILRADYMNQGIDQFFAYLNVMIHQVTPLFESMETCFRGSRCYPVFGIQFNTTLFLSLITLASTTFTAIWLWGAGVALFFFKYLTKVNIIMKGVRYALPVKDHPIGTVGIFISLIYIFVAIPLDFIS